MPHRHKPVKKAIRNTTSHHYGFLLGGLLFIIAFTGVSSAPLWAAEGLTSAPTTNAKVTTPQINIQADNIEYLEDDKLIAASGNVKITYDTYVIYAHSVFLDNAQKTILFPKGFVLEKDDNVIRTTYFDYNYQTFSGGASDLDMVIGKIRIHGRDVTFAIDQTFIRDATFTTCDYPDHPHYKVKSAEMSLYPQFGFLVASNDTLFVNDVPVFYFPSYIYGSRQYSVLGETSPVPEFGSNMIEGWFVKEHWGYYINPLSSGLLNFGYTEKLGLLIGAQHGLTFPNQNTLFVKGSYFERGGLEGRITYVNKLEKEEIPSVNNLNLSTLFAKVTRPAPALKNIAFDLAFREINPISRISLLPLLTLDLTRFRLPNEIDMNVQTNLGNISEEYNDATVTSWRTNLNLTFAREFNLGSTLYLINSLYYYGFWYTGDKTWQRALNTATLEWRLLGFKPALSYTYRLFNSGKNLFAFETYNIAETDEIGFKLAADVGKNMIGLELNYNLPDKKFRTVDTSITIDDHCWATTVTWKFIQKEFLFGIQLK